MPVALMEADNSYDSDRGEGSSVEGGQEYEREIRKYSSVWEIEEEGASEGIDMNNRRVNVQPLPCIEEELGSDNREDVVYVAVGKVDDYGASMDALLWTMNHAVNPSTLVFLIHVFPELRLIPTPLGKLPISQVNPEQKESYMIQERSKRREFIQKYLDVCSASKVKVDTILIESDMEAKAILDLIPILNIRKLVLGTPKSNLRKLRTKRGSGTADQVLQNAPGFCEVKIICEGKEVVLDNLSESATPRGIVENPSPKATPDEDLSLGNSDSFACGCFKRKVAR